MCVNDAGEDGGPVQVNSAFGRWKQLTRIPIAAHPGDFATGDRKGLRRRLLRRRPLRPPQAEREFMVMI